MDTKLPEPALLTLEAYRELILKLKELESLKSDYALLLGQNSVLISKVEKFEKIEKIFCRTCKHTNDHITLSYDVGIDNDDEKEEMTERTETWRFRCLGCQTIVTKEQKSLNWEKKGTPIFYPEIHKWHLSPKSSFDKVDKGDMKKLYHEAIICYNQEMEIPCSMSIRSLIESIGIFSGIKDKLIQQNKKTHEIKIETMVNEMVKDGIMTQSIASILKELRFLGNESAHSMVRHPKEELKLAILIVENIFENIFIIPKLHQDLSKISNSRRRSTNE